MVSPAHAGGKRRGPASIEESNAVESQSAASSGTPPYGLTRSAVDILFWGGIMVLLGHLIYVGHAGELHIAPHGRLGRMLLLVGGCMVYGCLLRSRLRSYAMVLMILCILQAALMAGGLAVYISGLVSPRVQDADVVMRAKSIEFGLDFAILLTLVTLLRAAGRSSRLGYLIGLLFYGILTLLCVLAPLWLPKPFWERLPQMLATTHAEAALMAAKVILTVAAIIALVKTRRLLLGHEVLPAPAGEAFSEADEDTGAGRD
jgi:hypothetical protein